MKSWTLSLQARLVIMTIIAMSVFGLIAGYESYRNALHENDEIFDAGMIQTAQTLAAVATFADDEHQAEPGMPVHKYQRQLLFQVIRRDASGKANVVLRSQNAPEQTLSLPSVPGFSDSVMGNQRWRFYRLQHDSDIDVIVGQNDEAREELAREIARGNITPFLVGLPLLAVISGLIIGVGLLPLRRLARELSERSPDELEPVVIAPAPKEIQPVADSINELFWRVRTTLDNERRFTSDAAHELRTPIAALRAQIEAAILEGPGNSSRSAANLLRAADHMKYLVEQLLLLSRLDSKGREIEFVTLSLAEFSRLCAADFAAPAVEKNIDLSLNVTDDPAVSGNFDLLYVLLRNLIDNAIQHVPERGEIVLGVGIDGDRAVFSIDDSGPGVANEKLNELGQRFHRMTPRRGHGAGLGLSIVLRIATLHNANVVFSRSTTLGGLHVDVFFPLTERRAATRHATKTDSPLKQD